MRTPARPGEPAEGAPRPSLERVFAPRSIAVVGASADPVKRGHQILVALDEAGYEGRVYAVNPRGGRILGLPVHESVESLPEAVDLAVLCTPPAAAPGLVGACGRRGVAGAAVLAVGFRETGAAGAELERRLLDAAREAGVRVIGPNTSGLLNLPLGVNLIGARGVRRGHLGLLVQSGNMALALMTELDARSGAGVSLCVGVGNQADVGFAEALDHLGSDPETHAVIVHAEGFRDARRFLAVAARVSRTKPVVLIKAGRTDRGARAAESHTGAVAGPYDRLSAGLRQVGVVEVTRSDELLLVAEALASQPPAPAGIGVAVLSDGGGQGALAVDALREAHVELAELATSTRERLRTLLGEAAPVENPVDLAGAADADPTAFTRALETLTADASVGVVLLVGLFGGYAIRFAHGLSGTEGDAARGIVSAMRSSGRGLVVHSMYAAHPSAPLDVLRAAGVPVTTSLEGACRAAGELWRRGRAACGALWRPESASTTAGEAMADSGGRGGVWTRLREAGLPPLTEPEARDVLASCGADFGAWEVAADEEATVAAVARAARPCVVKLVSPWVTHKWDVGGVILGVDSEAGAREAYRLVVERASVRVGAEGRAARATSVLVAPQLDAPLAELLVGAYRDPQLGPVLTVGAGGVLVEALRDVVHRVLPVDDAEMAAMLSESSLGRLLDGARGARVLREPILTVARAVATCMHRWSDVREVEVNPLFVYEDRATPVDARVMLDG